MANDFIVTYESTSTSTLMVFPTIMPTFSFGGTNTTERQGVLPLRGESFSLPIPLLGNRCDVSETRSTRRSDSTVDPRSMRMDLRNSCCRSRTLPAKEPFKGGYRVRSAFIRLLQRRFHENEYVARIGR